MANVDEKKESSGEIDKLINLFADQQKIQMEQMQKMFDMLLANKTSTVPENAELSTSINILNVPSFPEFNRETDQWVYYLKRLGHHFEAHKLTDEDAKKSYFLSWVGAFIYELLQKLFGTDNLGSFSFEQMTERVTEHFKKSVPLIVARHKFWRSRKRSDQTHAEWIAELRGLANDCRFSCPNGNCKASLVDEHIRDMIWQHTPLESVRKIALAEDNPSLERITQIAALHESTFSANKTLIGDFGDAEVNVMKPTYRQRTRSRSVSRNSFRKDLAANRSRISCPKCNINHPRAKCFHLKSRCDKCSKIGHIASVCLSKKPQFQTEDNSTRRDKKPQFSANRQDDIKEKPGNSVHMLESDSVTNKLYITPLIDGKELKFQVDTGASISVIGQRGYEILGKPHLKPASLQVKSYANVNIPLKGWTSVEVKVGNKSRILRLYVTDTKGENLFGNSWINAFGYKLTDPANISEEVIHMIETPELSEVNKKVNGLCSKFPNVFAPGLGTCNTFKAHFHLRPDATPVCHKPRPVPFSQKDAVKSELDRLTNEGVIRPVRTSYWAAPIVVVNKPNGKVRICGDFKVTVNPQLDIEQYPLPRPEELFQKLQGGKQFSKIDLADAYLQIELDEESKKLAVITTQHGLFEYQRLPFGISSAPAIFQRYLEQIISDLEGCANYLDDIIVTGRDEKEHFEKLHKLFERLNQHGLRCNQKKCEFFKPEVEYLGNIISESGIRPSDAGIQAIKNLPRPENLLQLQSLLGKVNYYSKFIPNFSQVAGPLNELRKKNAKFVWTAKQEQAFQKLKLSVINATKLIHYDPNIQLVLATDASSYGIGAVLSHRYADGSEKPIAFASKTLTDTQKKYSQIEKEALSIIFGVKKFHQYLYGLLRPFKLLTDHKPLLTLFAPDKKLPVMSLERLQRWAIFLMSYNYTIEYRSTARHSNADALSRLPAGSDTKFDSADVDCKILMLNSSSDDILNDFPLDSNCIEFETNADPILRRIRNFVENGWPQALSHKNDQLQPYFLKRLNITSISGVLIWQTDVNRVIIPAKLQAKVLSLLHRGHFGIVRMKQMARKYCWWPKINADIEDMVKNCEACQVHQSSPPRQYQSWPVPRRPWERIHIDYAGPFKANYWLIVVDAYSKFPYLCSTSSITSESTIRLLSAVFAIEGLPETIVSDNGTQFTSQRFQKFCLSHGIEHYLTAPFHPASNGEAERFVRTFKQSLNKLCWGGEKDIERAKLELLLAYRSTPLQNGKSPSELLHGRQIRTHLSLMLPDTDMTRESRDKSVPKFDVADKVFVRNFGVHGDPWLPGIVRKRSGRMVYEVQLRDNRIVRRHQNQIRKGSILLRTPEVSGYDDFLLNKTIADRVNRAAPHLNAFLPQEVSKSSNSNLLDQEVEVSNSMNCNPLERVIQNRSTKPEVQIPLRRSTRVRKKCVRFTPE